MSPFPPQDDDRQTRIITDVCNLLHDDSCATQQKVGRWIQHVLNVARQYKRFWFLDRLISSALVAGQDVIDLSGGIDTVNRVWCPRKLDEWTLSALVNARQEAMAYLRPNAGIPAAYALEAGRRVHLWPCPDKSIIFSILYSRPIHVAIVPNHWEVVILYGVLGLFGQHFDRDALTQNPAAYESRFWAMLRQEPTDGSRGMIVSERWSDLSCATSVFTGCSSADIGVSLVVPASISGLGYKVIECDCDSSVRLIHCMVGVMTGAAYSLDYAARQVISCAVGTMNGFGSDAFMMQVIHCAAGTMNGFGSDAFMIQVISCAVGIMTGAAYSLDYGAQQVISCAVGTMNGFGLDAFVDMPIWIAFPGVACNYPATHSGYAAFPGESLYLVITGNISGGNSVNYFFNSNDLTYTIFDGFPAYTSRASAALFSKELNYAVNGTNYRVKTKFIVSENSSLSQGHYLWALVDRGSDLPENSWLKIHASKITESASPLNVDSYQGALCSSVDFSEIFTFSGANTSIPGAHYQAAHSWDGSIDSYDYLGSVQSPYAVNIKRVADKLYPSLNHIAVTLHDGRIFISGGSLMGAGGSSSMTGKSCIYNPLSDTYELIDDCPNIMTERMAVVLNSGNVYVAGGIGESGTSNISHIYNISSNSWQSGTPLPVKASRSNCAMNILYDGRIVIHKAGTSYISSSPMAG